MKELKTFMNDDFLNVVDGLWNLTRIMQIKHYINCVNLPSSIGCKILANKWPEAFSPVAFSQPARHVHHAKNVETLIQSEALLYLKFCPNFVNILHIVLSFGEKCPL